MNPVPRFDKASFSRAPREDRSLVGITFVDVLFALVVGRILNLALTWQTLPATGIAHLSVAFVLTVASWIGYHNSWNRPRYFIRFANWPLAQFLIDICLVVVYWFTAGYVDEARNSLGLESSAIPEANLVALSFGFYVLWDRVTFRMRKAGRYPRLAVEYDAPERRKVTGLFALIVFLTMVYVTLLNPPATTFGIIAVDVWLVILLILYRVAKEAAFAPREIQPDTRSDLQEAARLLHRGIATLGADSTRGE